jgi:D-glycero-D-manno-heptose 1,7-bisphosphate phosphatase
MRLLPGAGEGIRRLKEHGYAVVVITNQSGVGAGYVTELTVVTVNDKMQRLLAEQGAVLDGIYFTVGAGDCAVLAGYRDTTGCKPSPAMLHRAARELHLTLEGGWMIGDRLTDLRTAAAAGVRPILVRTGDGKKTEAQQDNLPAGLLIADDLLAAALQLCR